MVSLSKLRRKWFKESFKDTPAEEAPARREADLSTRLEQAKAYDHPFYSRYYERLKEIGHMGSTPEFSAPTLVWHLGIWPLRTSDPQNAVLLSNEEITAAVRLRLNTIRPNARASRQAGKEPQEVQAEFNFHRAANKQFQQHTEVIDKHLNALLENLQKLGRANVRRDIFERIGGVAEDDQVSGNVHFDHLKREEIGFTVWWSDEGPLNGKAPGPDAIRVRVEVVRRPDYVTISFFLDATAGWRTLESPARKEAEEGRRRSEILQHIANVNRICGQRLPDSAAAKPLLPEQVQDADSGQQLLDASLCLYDDLWREFCRDFKLGSEEAPEDLTAITGNNAVGRVFGNFRGVVMPVEGLKHDQKEASDHSGSAPFARFMNCEPARGSQSANETKPNEANAAIKAYWPFIRRITPAMDYRDVIACGVMNWRCLVVTSLGSYVKDDPADEGESIRIDIPDKSLRIDNPDQKMTPAEPVRHLFMTRGKPNPAQIGRIVERVCTMETLRLYALKDWHVLQDASVHIRVLGQELDQIIHEWTVGRAYIEAQCNGKGGQKTPRPQQFLNDERDEWIAAYTRYIEERLLAIGAALDSCGQSCVGGIHYRIGRSRYYAEEFRNLLLTLRVGGIETWISYQAFAIRGLEPAFRFVNELGSRLDSLRRRLQAVTDGIEASALVAQTSATRQNTMELKKITKTARTVSLAGLLSALAIFASYMGLFVYQLVNTLNNPDTAEVARTSVWGLLSLFAVVVFAVLARRG